MTNGRKLWNIKVELVADGQTMTKGRKRWELELEDIDVELEDIDVELEDIEVELDSSGGSSTTKIETNNRHAPTDIITFAVSRRGARQRHAGVPSHERNSKRSDCSKSKVARAIIAKEEGDRIFYRARQYGNL
ncbi:unnamed protein product [Trichogramma brassicae]|uniref:Uncharacterized protein n=1 Tax=Trichogramma brassicae TaxID=86971 RepID=A0A6H5J0N8_9HYME|nr:unnamed protein product [Trichogramma brassicae]